MAEAAVEDPSQLKFYCHQCKVRFATVLPNFTCPHCSLGFIEEVEVKPEPRQDAPVPEDDDDEEPYNMLRYGDFHDLFLQPDAFERRGGNDRNRSSNPGSNRRRYGLIHPGISRRRVTRVTAARHGTPFENLIQEIVFNLGAAPDWVGGSGNMQFFLGNPGDYAWGREGLDAIVTQLLNQMDSTGPPPVSKEVIDALEIVEVTPEHVSTQLQCSVCWEAYVLREPVRQLPCGHIYHDACIRPWLLIHGTCPICRKHITENEATADGLSMNNPARTFEALDSILWGVNRSNSPSSSTATRGSDSPTSSNSSSSNRDPRM